MTVQINLSSRNYSTGRIAVETEAYDVSHDYVFVARGNETVVPQEMIQQGESYRCVTKRMIPDEVIRYVEQTFNVDVAGHF